MKGAEAKGLSTNGFTTKGGFDHGGWGARLDFFANWPAMEGRTELRQKKGPHW
jgi:hypothetical protein